MQEREKTALLWVLAAAACLIVLITVFLSAPSPVPPVVTTAAMTTVTQPVTVASQTTTFAGTTVTAAPAVVQTTFITSVVTVIIDLNTADKATLMLLSGMGETLAQRVIDYRTQYGGFDSVEELTNVSGIGEKRLAQWKPYLTVS